MAVRDGVVRWVLGVGAVLTVLAWHVVGPWASLVLVLLALAVAAVAYRVEAPRIDVEHPATWAPTERSPADRVDQ